MKTGNVFLGTLAGIAAGVCLGILFAPDKGAKTRKKILAKGEEYSDEIEKKFDCLLKAINEKCETVYKKTAEVVALQNS